MRGAPIARSTPSTLRSSLKYDRPNRGSTTPPNSFVETSPNTEYESVSMVPRVLMMLVLAAVSVAWE